MTRRLSLLSTRQEIELQTSFVCPPIATRSTDWSAIDANTYDAGFEGSDESGDHWSQGPRGMGATEAEAINDLFDQLLEAFIGR